MKKEKEKENYTKLYWDGTVVDNCWHAWDIAVVDNIGYTLGMYMTVQWIR